MTDPLPANKGEQRDAMFEVADQEAAIEHAWWGEIRTRAFNNPQEAFDAGFRAGVVWNHNSRLQDEHDAAMLRQTEIDQRLDRMCPDEIDEYMRDVDKGPTEL